MSDNYVVYKHTSPSGKHYIGITMQNPQTRWRNGNGYYKNKYFTNAIKKYGWDNFKHEILFAGLTKEEAEQKEIELIACYRSNQREYGYNMQNGGNSNGKLSEEIKRKISEVHKGMRYGEETKEKLRKYRTGRKHTEESKKKMSESRKGEKNVMYGKHHTDNAKRKISDARKGMKCSDETKRKISETSSVSVLQFDKNLNLINKYPSIKNASEFTNIDNGDISRVCRGKRKYAGGYIWRYESDCEQ